MRFGEFLLEENRISESDLVQAIKHQRSTQQPIGQLAIKNGFLTVHQSFEILAFQARLMQDRDANEKNGLMYGEIALGLGFLQLDQLTELLRLQLSTRLPMKDVLVELGILSEAEVDKHFSAFVATQ